MSGIVDANAVQSCFLPDPNPERVEARRGEIAGKQPRLTALPGQRRENLHRFRTEPQGARAGLGLFETRARAVFRQRPNFVPFEYWIRRASCLTYQRRCCRRRASVSPSEPAQRLPVRAQRIVAPRLFNLKRSNSI